MFLDLLYLHFFNPPLLSLVGLDQLTPFLHNHLFEHGVVALVIPELALKKTTEL